MMRSLGILIFVSCALLGRTTGADPNVPRPKYGAVAGTTFWSGPPYRGEKPISFGTVHPRDWVGDKEAQFFALEDVVVTAIPIGHSRAPKGRAREIVAQNHSLAIPSQLECWEDSPCTGVVVVFDKQWPTVNHRKQPVSLNLSQNGRTLKTIEIPARSDDNEIDISDLANGVYQLVEPDKPAQVTWLYRLDGMSLYSGPTNGNCRYSIDLLPGKYRVTAWHPYLKAIEEEVVVRAGIARRTNIVFTQSSARE